MSGSTARVTAYFGERSRSGGSPVAERLMAFLRKRGIDEAVTLRAGEGFGPKHGLHSAGLLTLSEDLPLVVVARCPESEARRLGGEVRTLLEEGLVTIEGATGIVEEPQDDRPGTPNARGSAFATGPSRGRLVVWIARQDQIDGLPAHASVVDTFKRHQALAAVSLLGVDGVKGGARRRARFFSGNRNVPMLVVGFGELEALRRIAKEVAGRFPGVGIESVPVTIEPSSAAGTTAAGSYMRISVLSGGSKPDSGIRRQQEMVRRLRGAGADGATAYFGLYGFEGSETPHGDSFLGIRRRIPVLTEIVDTAENCRRWVTEIEKLNAGSDLLAVSPVEVVSRPDGPA